MRVEMRAETPVETPAVPRDQVLYLASMEHLCERLEEAGL
jgi:hypothetical protein